MKNCIIVVGSLNMDFVVSVRHIPVPGETVLGSAFKMLAGGKGANQANAAARLACKDTLVMMAGCVGADMAGEQLKAGLASAGVDISTIQTSASHPTGVAFIAVDELGQNSITVAPGANLELSPADVQLLRPNLQQAHSVLVQLETPLGTVERVLIMAREAGVLTMLDPAPAQMLPPSLLSLVDVLTPNESEAMALTGSAGGGVDLEAAPAIAAELLAMGPRAVVLKLGARGCYYTDGAASHYSPAFPVAVKDTTAAGDTFNAALAVAFSERMDLQMALRFANKAASIAVTRAGAQASAPARHEVD